MAMVTFTASEVVEKCDKATIFAVISDFDKFFERVEGMGASVWQDKAPPVLPGFTWKICKKGKFHTIKAHLELVAYAPHHHYLVVSHTKHVRVEFNAWVVARHWRHGVTFQLEMSGITLTGDIVCRFMRYKHSAFSKKFRHMTAKLADDIEKNHAVGDSYRPRHVQQSEPL